MRGGRGRGNLEWAPVLLAALAFVAFVSAFGWELFAYQHKVVEWARRDLQSRADLAAANLDEPLRTQDFRKIHEFGAKCVSDGYRLTVFDARGRGCVFDTHRKPASEQSQFHAEQACGEYAVRLWIPRSEVLKPFRRALIGVGLAAFVGIAGVFLFFLVTYRQRVRIRELKRLEAFRREFIADVSHEIRTPLTGILGAVDMMEEQAGKPDGDRLRLLTGLVRKESKRLNGLVQSILDLARLERGDESAHRVETDVVGLVRETVDALEPAAKKAGVRLTFEADADERKRRVDPQLIGQAVSNLVTNALRHSRSEEVSVSLGEDGRNLVLSVEDHGVGIPVGESERIFERFHRIDPARAAETGGAGLGLSIVRRIAHLHGGEVVLEAAKPRGCRFILSIPV